VRGGGGISINNYLYEILGGHASWFVTSLVVLELVLLAGYKVVKNSRVWFLLGLCSFCAVGLLNSAENGGGVWQWRSAALALPFFSMGGVFRSCEKDVSGRIPKVLASLALTALYLLLLWKSDAGIDFKTAVCHNLPMAFVLSSVGCLMVVAATMCLPFSGLVSWIGRNTLPLYFLSGGCPMLVGMACKVVFPETAYRYTLLVALLSFAVALLMAWIIRKWLPFMLDISVLFQKGKD